jgi:hypothetical protein
MQYWGNLLWPFKTCKKHQNEPVNALFQLLYIAETSILSKKILISQRETYDIVQYLYFVKRLALKYSVRQKRLLWSYALVEINFRGKKE